MWFHETRLALESSEAARAKRAGVAAGGFIRPCQQQQQQQRQQHQQQQQCACGPRRESHLKSCCGSAASEVLTPQKSGEWDWRASHLMGCKVLGTKG
jgi:hypothetical protein